jgi:prepilin-type N-terminal cleavage/methylation domain-containing protein
MSGSFLKARATQPAAMRDAAWGFSLIELLVVVAIIAILIGILIPTLGAAKEQSKRSACLSNLRETHRAFAFYAQANNDQAPMGYRASSKQFNSMIYSATAGQFVLFGLLDTGGFMPEPRVFYCPSETNLQAMYATSSNPWPPGTVPGKQGYAGYGDRPEVAIPDVLVAGTTLPLLNNFQSKAIFADLTANASRVDTRHKTGINVLFGNGSAHWVDRGLFDTPLSQCGTPTAGVATWNPQQDAIWAVLDKQ